MHYLTKSILRCPWGVPLPCQKCGLGNTYASSSTSSYSQSSRNSQILDYSLDKKNDSSSPVRVYSGVSESKGKSLDDKFVFELDSKKKKLDSPRTYSFGMNNIYEAILGVKSEEDIDNDNRSFEWASRRMP